MQKHRAFHSFKRYTRESLSSDLEITPQQLARIREHREPVRLIDVREPFELQLGHLEDAEAIPMRSIPAHLASLDDDERPIVVMCHHGVRSLQVVCWLREQGVENCRSLAGGIDRWSLEVDPAVPRY